jgi:hypothetical protein
MGLKQIVKYITNGLLQIAYLRYIIASGGFQSRLSHVQINVFYPTPVTDDLH